MAQYKYREIKKLIVIATETKYSEGRSEDIIAFDFSEKLNREKRLLAQKLMREDKILDSFISNNYDSYRPVTPNDRDNKVGRNELCPCGSGKKYKKCHYLQ